MTGQASSRPEGLRRLSLHICPGPADILEEVVGHALERSPTLPPGAPGFERLDGPQQDEIDTLKQAGPDGGLEARSDADDGPGSGTVGKGVGQSL